MRRFPSLAAPIFVLATLPAAAQTARPLTPGLETYASIGYGGISRFDDSTDFGSGVAVGGGIGYRPFKYMGFEFDIYSLPSLQESVSSAFVATPGVVFSAPATSRVQPYAVAGFGAVVTNHRQSTYLVRQEMREFSDTGWGPMVGGGVRFMVSPRISIRADARFNAGLLQTRENLDARRVSLIVRLALVIVMIPRALPAG